MGPLLLPLIALVCASIYWLRYSYRDDTDEGVAAIKAASTGLLAVFLWVITPMLGGEIWPIALGLTLGAVGDWFLARPGEKAFLAGMAAFGAGHSSYIGGFYLLGWFYWSDWQREPADISSVTILLLVALALIVLSTEYWLIPRTNSLRWPVRVYVLLVGMTGAAAALFGNRDFVTTVQIGVALFIVSDLLLAMRIFVVTKPRKQMALSLTLWPAYWAGQLMICLGSWEYVIASV